MLATEAFTYLDGTIFRKIDIRHLALYLVGGSRTCPTPQIREPSILWHLSVPIYGYRHSPHYDVAHHYHASPHTGYCGRFIRSLNASAVGDQNRRVENEGHGTDGEVEICIPRLCPGSPGRPLLAIDGDDLVARLDELDESHCKRC